MSCCGSNCSNFFTRSNVGRNCCTNQCENSCCDQDSNNNSCCNGSSNNSSCCNRNSNNNSCCNRNSNNNSCCNRNSNRSCLNSCCCNDNDNDDLNGISCPFHNNNDCDCERCLRDALCNLTNQRVIIHTDGCKMCVVIVSVGCCFVKTINPCTQRIVYFNINRIDNVEDVLPRCY